MISKYRTEILIFLTVFIIYSFFTFLKIFRHLSVEDLAADQYFQIANNLIQYHSFSLYGDSPTALRMPGYPFFLAIAFKALSNWWAVLFLQNFIVGLSAVILYLIAKNWLSPFGALLTVVLWAFEPYAVDISSQFMTEPLYVFFLLITVFIFIQYKDKLNKKLFILIVTLLLAILTYIRPISVFLPIVFAIAINLPLTKIRILPLIKEFFSKNSIVQIAIILIIFFLFLSPWLLRNYFVLNSWALSSDTLIISHLLSLVFEADQKGLGMNVIDREPPDFLRSGDVNNVQQTKNQALQAFRKIYSKPLLFTKFYLKNAFISTFSSSWWGSLRNLFKGSSGQVNYSKEVAQSILRHDIKQILTWSGKDILAAAIMIAGIIFWIITFIFFFIGSYAAFKYSDDKLRAPLFLLFGLAAYMLLIGNIAVGDTIRYRFAVSPIIIMLAIYGLFSLVRKFKKTANVQ